MGAHLIDGEFQSDKYPTCPRGKVPLSVKDPTAQDLLWEYAQRRRSVDAEFSDDLETAVLAAGYRPAQDGIRTEPPWDDLDPGIRDTVRALWDAGYEPTDSGDGSKAGTMECAIEVAHVFMRCDPADLVRRAGELLILVSDWPESGDYNGNRVEASYSPSDGIGVLSLFGCLAPEVGL